ncbi:hypothetical protein [Mastigocladopsis repens]|uniref:hypothetical protein n=1 Tax=Mastigocladopsis repens TaxID=221287 RepID=UPI0002F2D526|nr:hypothetical protein [Mastigocladopsis repens]
MANIKISELRPAGAELFQDSESFLNELNDQEMSVFGGGDGDVVVTVDSNVDTLDIKTKDISVSIG